MSLPVWLPGAMFLLEVGGICPGVSVQGVLYKETPWNQKSVWYVSYWNAFLLVTDSLTDDVQKAQCQPHNMISAHHDCN